MTTKNYAIFVVSWTMIVRREENLLESGIALASTRRVWCDPKFKAIKISCVSWTKNNRIWSATTLSWRNFVCIWMKNERERACFVPTAARLRRAELWCVTTVMGRARVQMMSQSIDLHWRCVRKIIYFSQWINLKLFPGLQSQSDSISRSLAGEQNTRTWRW